MSVHLGKLIGFAFALSALTISALAGPDSPWSFGLRLKMNDIVHASVSANLQLTLKKYNELASQPKAWAAYIRKPGMQTVPKNYFASFEGKTLIPAIVENGEIVLRQGGHEIAMSEDDVLDRSVRVDGKRFQWDLNVSSDENIKRYERLFSPARHVSIENIFFLSSSAWASSVENYKLFEVSGILLAFVNRDPEVGGLSFTPITSQVRQMPIPGTDQTAPETIRSGGEVGVQADPPGCAGIIAQVQHLQQACDGMENPPVANQNDDSASASLMAAIDASEKSLKDYPNQLAEMNSLQCQAADKALQDYRMQNPSAQPGEDPRLTILVSADNQACPSRPNGFASVTKCSDLQDICSPADLKTLCGAVQTLQKCFGSVHASDLKSVIHSNDGLAPADAGTVREFSGDAK